MTTDYEKMKTLFDDLGVEYEAKEFAYLLLPDDSLQSEGRKYNQQLKIKEGIGYYRFYTEFYFFDGKYIDHGCWE